jgi:hypothetical protein
MTHPSLARAPAARIAPAQGALANWLVDTVQCMSGPHAGAVAGCVTASGSASYVYPEIAGYYLQWLAWRATRFGSEADLAPRAAAVERWLARWLAMAGPPTRVHLDGTRDDWRNQATFCFDLAMVLRGIGSATQAKLIAPDASVVEGVLRALERLLASDGSFHACIVHAPDASLPERWSTRRGAFLAKAAAGVLRASTALAHVPATITRAAERTFTASLATLASAPHRETHALLYALEGVLNLPRHPRFHDTLPLVSAQFDDLLAQAGSDGHLPEILGLARASGPVRVDVMAQALRIGYLLTAHRPQQPPDRVALARIRQALQRQVRAGSGVPFARGSETAHSNVWATMFTDQALAFATPVRDADAWWRTDPMIV